MTIFPFLQEKDGYEERDIEGWKLVSSQSEKQVLKLQRDYNIASMNSQKECDKWTDWELDELGFHFHDPSVRLTVSASTLTSNIILKI